MNNTALQTLGSKLMTTTSMLGLKAKKYSPEILLGVGITGMIAGAIFASKATLKADEVAEEHNFKMEKIHDAVENKAGYTDRDKQEDTVLTYYQTAVGYVKLYLPAATLIAGGAACILSAHGIMKKRNAALAMAYTVVEQAFSDYRGRVVEELGKEKDFHFRYNTDYEEIVEETVNPETGKKTKTKKTVQVAKDDAGTDMYARYFEKQVFDPETGSYTGSSQWSPQPEYNAAQLVLKNGWANEMLRAKGYLFLNDVYEELGFPRTKAGQIVGWINGTNGIDNYVSFGPEVDAIINKTDGYMSYRRNHSILCDFNVDGPILDLIS